MSRRAAHGVSASSVARPDHGGALAAMAQALRLCAPLVACTCPCGRRLRASPTDTIEDGMVMATSRPAVAVLTGTGGLAVPFTVVDDGRGAAHQPEPRPTAPR